MSYMIMAVFLLLKFAYSSSPLDDFIFNGSTMKLDGTAKIDSKGLLMLTNSTSSRQTGHAFYNDAIQFKNSTNNGSVISFFTTFIFEIVPKYPSLDGHGMAFVISPSKELRGARPAGYLGLFDDINTGSSSNHIVAVEIDTFKGVEFDDRDDNHIGIDINGLKSIISASAGYFPAAKNGTFKDLKLKNGDPMQVWVEYNGVEKQINVTLSPINVTKLDLPLISLRRDLPQVILDTMYVGFSTSTGRLTASDYYILSWSFKMNGEAEQIDLSRIPKIPQPSQKIDREPNAVLEVSFPFILFLVLLLVSLIGGLLISRKKFINVLEDWEAIDQSLGTEYVVEEAELVLKLGLLCSHAMAAARPSMSIVIKYLEGEAKLPDNLSDIIRSQILDKPQMERMCH
ncbi:L-type lectin-domain containing receptor kinase V.9 [Camellia lanceoleosa]|uniref:L-type lectin-domain containing receptor kinase V.9 n=1 Tax=Camellia lanceoleosa TaxID=1840588 RepID=A0ACC0G974_9ERIC|nr:L-type lectin-domain containing receptor kinase V.9 [Camellia lanceoleosa]